MKYRILKLGSKNNAPDSVGLYKIESRESETERWKSVAGSVTTIRAAAERHLETLITGDGTEDEVVKEVDTEATSGALRS